MNDLKFTTAGDYMEDPRCCGTGSCIINNEGDCWCGQRWDGEKMCFPKLEESKDDTETEN